MIEVMEVREKSHLEALLARLDAAGEGSDGTEVPLRDPLRGGALDLLLGGVLDPLRGGVLDPLLGGVLQRHRLPRMKLETLEGPGPAGPGPSRSRTQQVLDPAGPGPSRPRTQQVQDQQV